MKRQLIIIVISVISVMSSVGNAALVSSVGNDVFGKVCVNFQGKPYCIIW
jgi:hypothetical protein